MSEDYLKLNISTNDIGTIKTLYDAILKDEHGTLEAIANDGTTIENPSWKELKQLHEEYGNITLNYKTRE